MVQPRIFLTPEKFDSKVNECVSHIKSVVDSERIHYLLDEWNRLSTRKKIEKTYEYLNWKVCNISDVIFMVDDEFELNLSEEEKESIYEWFLYFRITSRPLISKVSKL